MVDGVVIAFSFTSFIFYLLLLWLLMHVFIFSSSNLGFIIVEN